MLRYFGTDGIRDRYGAADMCPEFAARFGWALGAYLAQGNSEKPLNVIIGRDPRPSGGELAGAIARGLNVYSSAIYIHDGGIVPTPAVARTVVENGADLGIVVTASHNPASDNGFKLFNGHGFKLSVEEEHKIEVLIDQAPNLDRSEVVGKTYRLDVAAFYINHLQSLMDQHCLKDWRIVLDLANGAACQTSPALFARWGAGVVILGNDLSQGLINDGVGSEYPQRLSDAVLKHQAHVGIAHDGDGDRLVVSDEKGQIVDGDQLLGLLGVYAMRSGALAGNTLVATVQSNSGLDHAMADVGGKVERVDVGDRNVAERMRALGANIGGESSGHIILSDFATTGDGALAAIKLIDLMCKTGKRLSELVREITLFPQATRNLTVSKKIPIDELGHLQKARSQVESRLGNKGRVLIRYSGTEPKIRLLVESGDPALNLLFIEKLECALRKDLSIIDG